MAKVLGTGTLLPTTGLQAINVGILGTSMECWLYGNVGNDAYDHSSHGLVVGSTQKVLTRTNSLTEAPTNGKVIRWLDNSNNVIAEGTFAGFSGTHVNFNITTAPPAAVPILLKVEN